MSDEETKVTAIRPNLRPEAKDVQRINSLLFARVLEVVDGPDFDNMTIAAAVGVMEMVKHQILTRQDDA